MANAGERFIIAYQQGGDSDICMMRVLIDRATGVNYLYHKVGYSGGLTVLLGKDGKPIITPVG